MTWDGNGAFSRTKDWTDDRDAAIKILASRHDENDDELTVGIGACLTKNNESKPTADFKPNADNAYSFGSSALRWINIFLTSIKFQQASFAGTLGADTLTGARTYTLPDKSGTLELQQALTTVSGNATLTAADFPGMRIVTATATLALPAASTVTAGRRQLVKSATTGDVQLDPAGSDTIDGVNANVRIPSFDIWEIVSDGVSAWNVIRKGSRVIGDVTVGGYGTATSGEIGCDGASLLRATYAGLFAVIGTAFGSADGTHFNVPDLRGRAIIGQGTGSGLTARTLAATGGEELHVLLEAELAAHTHGLTGAGNSGLAALHVAMTPNTGTTIPSDSTGSGTGHNTMQPFIVLNAYIKT